MNEEFPSAEEPEVKAEPVEKVKAPTAKKSAKPKAEPKEKAEPKAKKKDFDGQYHTGEKYQVTTLNDQVLVSQQGWIGPAPLAIHKDDVAEVVGLLNKV